MSRIVRALLLAACAAAATVLAQRPVPTPTPKVGAARAAQPIPGGLPNPYLVEIGTLKQQVTALQQIVNELQAKNGLLEKKIDTLEKGFGKLANHRHSTNLGFTNWLSLSSGSCPTCLIALTPPGQSATQTGPPWP
jgi:hypothetical protein